MPASSTIAHVFVALLVLHPGRVGVRQLVDQAQLRRARQHPRQVHLLDLGVAVAHPAARHQLQSLRLCDRLHPAVRLQVTDHDVAAGLRLGLALLQHPERLAHAGGHADEDLQVTAIAGHRLILLDAAGERRVG